MEGVFDEELQCMSVDFAVTNESQSVSGTAEMRFVPQRWTDGGERNFYMKDLEKKSGLHVFLSLALPNGERIVVFDRVMTDFDYDAELRESWFDDKQNDIERRKR